VNLVSLHIYKEAKVTIQDIWQKFCQELRPRDVRSDSLTTHSIIVLTSSRNQ